MENKQAFGIYHVSVVITSEIEDVATGCLQKSITINAQCAIHPEGRHYLRWMCLAADENSPRFIEGKDKAELLKEIHYHATKLLGGGSIGDIEFHKLEPVFAVEHFELSLDAIEYLLKYKPSVACSETLTLSDAQLR